MKDSSSDSDINIIQPPPERLTRSRKLLVFIIIALALFMNTVDSTIVATALHTLQTELNTNVSWVGWTMTAYAFGFVLMLPLSAKLSIRYGHRRIFVISIALFTLTSFLCGMANNIHTLIVLRVFQAVGGAGITPSATGIIVDHFGKSRDRAVSLFGSIFPIGAMIGPVFGGFFVTYLTWRWIFFVNVPIGLAVVLLGLKYIPRDLVKVSNFKEKMDFKGLAFLAVGILCSMYAATYLGEPGHKITSVFFISLVIGAGLGIFGFFRHIKKVKNPFVAPRLVYGKGFGIVNLLNILYSGMTIGVISLVPLYATRRYGLSELDSGTLLIAQGIASVILSAIMTMLLRRTGYRLPLFIGCSIIITGIFLLTLKPQFGLSPYVWLAATTFLIGIGKGTISPPGRNAGLQLAPEQSATVAALRSLCIQLGGIISISVVTAILAASSESIDVQAKIYMGVAALLLLSLPLISRIPEHKGSW